MDEHTGSTVLAQQQQQQQYQNYLQHQHQFAYTIDPGQPIFSLKPIQKYQQNFNNYLGHQPYQQLYQSNQDQTSFSNIENNAPNETTFYFQPQYQSNPNYQNAYQTNESNNSNQTNSSSNYYQFYQDASSYSRHNGTSVDANTTNHFNSSQTNGSFYTNGSINKKRSSEMAVLSVPRYIKPKMCKTPLIIHLVNSVEVPRPRPQIATLPPELPPPTDHQSWLSRHNSNNSSVSSEYLRHSLLSSQHSQHRQSLLPPIFPHQQHFPSPPPIYTNNMQSSTSSISSASPPSSLSNRRSILSNNNPPVPPLQRPSSPPKVPPPLLPRLNGYYASDEYSMISRATRPLSPPSQPPPPPPQAPPQIPLHNKLTTQNMLRNTVLNNSLNSDFNRNLRGGSNYEQQFNDSFNSSITHNNTVSTPYHPNGNQYQFSYQQLLNSPNLYTLFDRKKQPPPPYPGNFASPSKKNGHTSPTMMDTNEQPVASILQQSPSKQLAKVTEPQQLDLSTKPASTVIRKCAPQAFKFFMEQHAQNVFKYQMQRDYRRTQLEIEMDQMKELDEAIKNDFRMALRLRETLFLRMRRVKLDKSMFETISTLGIGAFGEVYLVRKKDKPSSLFAMKILSKSDVHRRNDGARVKAERDILAQADSEWVVKLFYSFQDTDNLYFVMEYVPGGDMMHLLITKQVFDEPLARFYIGELTCAIESVHALNYIHRDIKPDNILIDRNGHIKLTDFGLCTGFNSTQNLRDEGSSRPLDKKIHKTSDKGNSKRHLAYSLVGTPSYMAPEIILKKAYNKSCDWWSVGVILYEMLVGKTPFRDETPIGTQDKVINWKHTLKIPKESKLSAHASNLILKLCTSSEHRLDGEGIKAHPFFRGFDFGPGLRHTIAPYIPELANPTDTSNFDDVDPAIINERKARRERHRQNQYQMDRKVVAAGAANSDYYSNEQSLMNMYEFTFRRFINSADSQATQENVQSHTADQPSKTDANESMETGEVASSAVTVNEIVYENSLNYQTEQLIDNTKRIQLRESTNSAINNNGIGSSSSSSGYFGSVSHTIIDMCNNENTPTVVKQPAVYI